MTEDSQAPNQDSSHFSYSGSELELFHSAVNWKETLRRHIQPHIRGKVLEVGAGIGGTTRVLRTGGESSWTCLEPDDLLARQIRAGFPAVKVITGDLEALSKKSLFQTILYVDVLEHIEDDAGEVRRAAQHLVTGGRLLVLAPAHQWLFTPFDAAIGHYRRYNRSSMQALTPPVLNTVRLIYLDSVGMLASAANRLLLSQSQPRPGQIRFWDHYMVPASRVFDRLLAYRVGKSVLAVWEKVDRG